MDANKPDMATTAAAPPPATNSDTAPLTDIVTQPTAIPVAATATTMAEQKNSVEDKKQSGDDDKAAAASTSVPDTAAAEENPLDFQGSVDSNNELPSAETLRKIEDYIVLDRHGRTHPFKSLYSGKHVARRVLIIFVRHFFCGNCQEYLRSLSTSITPESLLRLPISTFIAVVGCGDPGLIPMYASETSCPFPIYADPTRKLYAELGMIRTLALGSRPAYMTKSIIKSTFASVVQGLKQIRTGMATKAGDQRQIGGEFLFEPLDLQSPIATPWAESADKTLGSENNGVRVAAGSDPSLDGLGHDEGHDSSPGIEAKRVTWCHRMRTTRDHAEIPELMEVLGLDGHGMPIDDKKRWSRALETRKGTGLSMASQMSQLSKEMSRLSAMQEEKGEMGREEREMKGRKERDESEGEGEGERKNARTAKAVA